jgi:hypothetical protein
VLARTHERSTTEIRSKNSLYRHRHFTEHLVGAFGKSPRESDLNQKLLSLLIRQLKNYTRVSYCNNPHHQIQRKNRNFNGGSKNETARRQRLETYARADFWNQDQSTVDDLACAGSNSIRQTESWPHVSDRPWSGEGPLLRVAETGPAAHTH